MGKKNGKLHVYNGFPSDDNGNLYDDGFSFDEAEYEEDEDEDVVDETPDLKYEAYRNQQQQKAEEYKNLSTKQASRMSDEELCALYDADMAERDLKDDEPDF